MNENLVNIYNGLKVKMFYALAALFIIRYVFFITINISHNQDALLIINTAGLLAFLVVTAYLHRNTGRIKTATQILVYASTISIFLPIFLNVTSGYSSMYLARDVAIANILLFVMAFMAGRLNTIIFAAVLIISFVSLKIGWDVYVYSSYNTYLIVVFIIAGCFIYVLLANLIESTIKTLLEGKLKTEGLLHFKRKITQFIFHDLQIPVNAIIELNAKSKSSNALKTKYYAQTIKRQLEDILDTEKMEEEALVLKKENVLISEIIHKAVVSVEVLAKQKNININYNFVCSGYLNCDRYVIERVVINLLVNAIKFSYHNSEVAVDVKGQDQQCHISVKDKGIGMKPEHLDKIFDKFYRVEQSAGSGTTPSSGLGLAFCRLAVQSHGGIITVVSEEKEGSEFTVKLPDFVSGPEGEKITKKKLEKIYLSKLEKEQVRENCLRLSGIPIYKMGEIIPVLISMEKTQSKNIKNWVEAQTHAVYCGNQEHYTTLNSYALMKDASDA